MIPVFRLKQGDGGMNDEPEGKFAFAQPVWLDEVSSTSDYLKKAAAEDVSIPSGAVVAARRQVKGRGRMGGTWYSSREGDLTFSFLWKGRFSLEKAGTLPIACAMAVGDFLALPEYGIATKCKWPNDVMAGDAKICGILTEGGLGAGEGLALVVGIGVNLRAVPERDGLVGRATISMEDLVGRVGDAEDLLPKLLLCLESRLSLWGTEGFAALRSGYAHRLWGVGRPVAVKSASGVARGVIAGVGDNGELVFRNEVGTETIVTSVSTLDYEDFQ